MKRTTKNIIIAVAVMAVGIAIMIAGLKLYQFRIDGGYSSFDFEEMTCAVLGLITCILEWVLQLFGLYIMAEAAKDIFNTIKMMR